MIDPDGSHKNTTNVKRRMTRIGARVRSESDDDRGQANQSEGLHTLGRNVDPLRSQPDSIILDDSLSIFIHPSTFPTTLSHMPLSSTSSMPMAYAPFLIREARRTRGRICRFTGRDEWVGGGGG